MSKISLSPNSSGTGTFTIQSPAGDTNRTLTLPDEDGALLSADSSLDAANLTGTLPAIDGSALTGVGGGATSVLVAPTTFSSVSSLTLALPSGYRQHIVKFRDVKIAGSTTKFLYGQFGNAAGVAQTGNVYSSTYTSDTSSMGYANGINVMRFGLRHSGATYGGGIFATFRIHDAEVAGARSTYIGYDMFTRSNVTYNLAVMGAASTSQREENANIKFFMESNETFSGEYEVWGVNPS